MILKKLDCNNKREYNYFIVKKSFMERISRENYLSILKNFKDQQIISINFENADYEELQDRKKLYEYIN